MSIDQKTLQELKEALLQEKRRLESELAKIAKPTDKPDEYKTIYEDIGDETDENATEVQMYSNRLAIKEDLEKELKDVDDALEKMKKGTYGICEKCGKEIEIERLKAYPMARTCIQCARQEERK